eukprot:jgi/Mesen1/4997/ME000248S04282
MSYRANNEPRSSGGGLARMFSQSQGPQQHQVELATSDLLIGPDWGLNMELCDAVNTDPGQAKGVVKALKKRLANKNPKIQLLSLTLLETLIKNCGEFVHAQVADSEILAEMVKIARKKTDMQVRDRVLELLDTWQEAFGGSHGRFRQYWAAYNELRSMGVQFTQRQVERSAPIFTPPRSTPHVPFNQSNVYPQPSYNSPAYGSPLDAGAAKEDVIVELADQVGQGQRRVMSLINSTSDEVLLREGLGLNDDLQKVLTKYDAAASGAPLPVDEHPTGPVGGHPAAGLARFDHEEDLEEDDDSQLHRSGARQRLQPGAAVPFIQPPPGNHHQQSVDLLSGGGSGAGGPPASAPPQGSYETQAQAAGGYPGQQQPARVHNPFEEEASFGSSPTFVASSLPPQPAASHGEFGAANGAQQQQGLPGGESTYVAPWAMGNNQGMTPQQRAYIYGSQGQGQESATAQYPVQQQQQQQQSPPTALQQLPTVQQSPPPSNAYAPSYEQAPVQPSMSPQQQSLLYGNNLSAPPTSSPAGQPMPPPLALPPPPTLHAQRQLYFKQNSPPTPDSRRASYPLDSQAADGGAHKAAAAAAPSGPTARELAKNINPMNEMFGDLVDLSGFKPKAGSIGGAKGGGMRST